MKKIMLVFGTRPEAIKMCPLVNELEQRGKFKLSVCVTGQHREMLDGVLKLFGVIPDRDLDIMSEGQTLFEVTERVLSRMRGALEAERPDAVLVHGDTSTAFAAALACFYMKIPVCHVEAGLRTHNVHSPYPEEFNRQAVGLISELHFAPTERARQNLLGEGKDCSKIFVTGNTAIDALKTTVRANYNHPILTVTKGKRIILLTAHRRENTGEPMRALFRAVNDILNKHTDARVVYPVHMNPTVRQIATEELAHRENVILTEPLDTVDFHNVMARSHLVITDSGGIQEEAPALGVPVLVARDTTERPEGVEAGTLKLVGTDRENIFREADLLLSDKEAHAKMARTANPYGDGHAAATIATALERFFGVG